MSIPYHGDMRADAEQLWSRCEHGRFKATCTICHEGEWYDCGHRHSTNDEAQACWEKMTEEERDTARRS